MDVAKRGFYRAANGIFGKIGRTASEEVVLELIRTKFIPILLYSLDVLPLYQYQLRSLDSVINRLFMKLFRTSDIQVVAQCQEEFCFDLPSVQLARSLKKFLDKLYHCHSV